MKFRRLICLLLSLICLFGCVCFCVSGQDLDEVDPSVTSGSHGLDGRSPLLGNTRLIDNCKATLIYETTTDTLLHAFNADNKLYPASLVKIMTAYVALEQGSLDDIVTIREDAFRALPKDSISVRLKEGEKISLESLLYCMIVQSANDASAAIAEHIAGTQVAFVTLMNAYAKELGCTNTNFTNPHGIHHENQYSTARDVARILAAAMKNEDFRTIFKTAKYTVPATNLSDPRNLTSGNHLMHTESMSYYFDERVTGGRTGVDYQGFRHLAGTAEENGMELVTVVIGSVSEFEPDGVTVKSFGGFLETSNLLNHGFNNYRKRQIVSADQVMRQISVLNGDCDLLLGVKDSVSTILPSGVKLDDLTFRYTDVLNSSAAPVKRGTLVSHLQVWYGPNCLVQTDVFALNDVSVATQKVVNITLNRNGLPWWAIVLIVFGGVILSLLIVLFSIRAKNMRKHRNQNPYRRR